MQTSTPLLPGNCYHIYNRGNNRENIFLEERNYAYFLRLYTKYMFPVAETFAYCLMRNHFHFLIRIRSHKVGEPQNAAALAQAGQPFAGSEPAKGLSPTIVSRHFSHLFNSYAQAINKAYGRTGALFQKRFGRVLVDNDRYFLTLLHYIHSNPQKHGFVKDFRTYPYSSYSAFLSTQPTLLNRDEVLSRFGSPNQFEVFHREVADEKSIRHLVEDDAD